MKRPRFVRATRIRYKAQWAIERVENTTQAEEVLWWCWSAAAKVERNIIGGQAPDRDHHLCIIYAPDLKLLRYDPTTLTVFIKTVSMSSARILKMAPFRAAAMRQPIVRQAFQRQARPFHNTRTMLRTKVILLAELLLHRC